MRNVLPPADRSDCRCCPNTTDCCLTPSAKRQRLGGHFNDWGLKRLWLGRGTIGFGTLLVLCSPLFLPAQNPSTENQLRDIDAAVTLTRTYPEAPAAHGTGEAPSVRCGERVRFHLTVTNDSHVRVVIDRIETGCRCVAVRCESREIAPKSSIPMEADFVAPMRGNDGKYLIQLGLLDDSGQRSGSLYVSGPLENQVEIIAPDVLEAFDDLSEWRIPVLATPPADPSRLEIATSETLRDLSRRIEVADGKPFLHLAAPLSALGPSGISGDLIVSDPVSGANHTHRVTIVKRPPVRVTPLAIRFRPVNGDLEHQEATVLVQSLVSNPHPSSGSLEPANERVSIPSILGILCEAEGYSIELTSKEINPQLFRLHIHLTADRSHLASRPSLSKEVAIRWKVSTTSDVYSVQSTGFLE